MDKKANEAEKEFLNRTLTLEDLKKMDFGGDGSVNYQEFLVFMLTAMGKVSEEDLQEIEVLFHKLDVDDDGLLEVTDVVAMAYGDESVKSSLRGDSALGSQLGSLGGSDAC